VQRLSSKRRALGFLAVLLLMLTPLQAHAMGDSAPVDGNELRKVYPSEGKAGEEFREVAGALRCPTCTGLSTLQSDAKFSLEIKDIVAAQVQAGKTKDQILQYFTERYGPWILREPPKRGFSILAWALPLAMLLGGPPLVWLFVWRKRRVESTMGVRSAEDIVNEMNARLDELRNGAQRRAGGQTS